MVMYRKLERNNMQNIISVGLFVVVGVLFYNMHLISDDVYLLHSKIAEEQGRIAFLIQELTSLKSKVKVLEQQGIDEGRLMPFIRPKK